jgi:hypothetical protein
MDSGVLPTDSIGVAVNDKPPICEPAALVIGLYHGQTTRGPATVFVDRPIVGRLWGVDGNDARTVYCCRSGGLVTSRGWLAPWGANICVSKEFQVGTLN